MMSPKQNQSTSMQNNHATTNKWTTENDNYLYEVEEDKEQEDRKSQVISPQNY